MNRLLKTTILSAAVAATALLPLGTANAGQRHYGGHGRYEKVERDADGRIIAAGIIGVAIGAIIGGAVANADDAEPVEVNPYRHPRPSIDREVLFGSVVGTSDDPEPEVVYYDDVDAQSFEPWSRDWYRYCEDRYRSFDPETGTFVGYDGVERFCVAN